MKNYMNIKLKRTKDRSIAVLGFTALLFSNNILHSQVPASGSGFNYFERQWITDNSFGAGYSFYAAVWPIMEQYPGADNFQLGLPSTWLSTLPTGNEPSNFYTTIEGGLGWWRDTRFATETPKFIMGGVALNFSQWANGAGAGSSANLPNGQRDWSTSGGKYGVAQLSKNLLWPPDGLNIEQGANGDFLGYGYHPLPLTDSLDQTYGYNFATGNQCWTLFLNSTNFRGPTTFFIPTFWTETVLNDPSLEGLLLDSRPSDKNLAFAIEYAESPALIGFDTNGDTYARVIPLNYPASSEDESKVIREISVFSKEAKWNQVENWFNGGVVPSTEFESLGKEDIVFSVTSGVDGNITTQGTNTVDADIDHAPFAEKIMSLDQRSAGFKWDTTTISESNGMFVMPIFYKLNTSTNLWEPISESSVPSATGLLNTEPSTTPRSELTYLTPKESDCHLQDPQSPWNAPGPVAGPYTVSIGDGSKLTYYWYKFIDQPSIIHANLPEPIRQNLQNRVELIHSNWNSSDNYLPALSEGSLVGLDNGLIVEPPAGMEVGYVPIVTRQEKDPNASIEELSSNNSLINVYPNPAHNSE